MGYFNYSQKSTLRHWQTQLEMVAKMAKESEQTTLIWWDGKQKLSDFELGIEQPKMANKPNNRIE